MGMGEAIGLFFSRYTDFQGRSRRAEYWWFFLAYIIFTIAVAAMFFILGGGIDANGDPELGGASIILLVVVGLIGLGLIIPMISLAVRRFHDLGQTGWLVLVFGLLGLIPLVGTLTGIGQLIWFAMPGTVGPNQYGPDPKGGHDVDVFS